MRNDVWNARRVPLAAVLAVLAGVALFGGFALGRRGWAAEPAQTKQSTGKPRVSNAEVAAATAPLANMESGFIAIAEKMEPSVVSIRVNKTIRNASMGPDIEQFFQGFPGFEGQGPRLRMSPRQFKVSGAGSGVIVREDGWILTNDHVVSGADKVTVKLSDGRELDGTVRQDFHSDLALVKINASNLIPADLGDSDRVRVGQWAMAFGSPFELDKTMTLGIISARARQEAIGGPDERRAYSNLLQTDAPINPGNSGGPLVDIRGRVVGINVAIESPSGGSVGIGFAIPVNTAKDVMDQLISKGRVTRGRLGVAPRALSAVERERLGVANGAMVIAVPDGTPASKAGIEPGDVIVRFNGHAVADDISLREAVARLAPGTRVDVVVRRDGREKTFQVTLDTLTDSQPGQETPQETPQAGGGKLGVRVQGINPDVAKQYNLGVNTGVVIVEVQQGGPGEEAGLQPGDVILRINGKAVTAPGDVISSMQSAKSGETVQLIIHRGKTRELVSVKIP